MSQLMFSPSYFQALAIAEDTKCPSQKRVCDHYPWGETHETCARQLCMGSVLEGQPVPKNKLLAFQQ
jgi:hypothetical protein